MCWRGCRNGDVIKHTVKLRLLKSELFHKFLVALATVGELIEPLLNKLIRLAMVSAAIREVPRRGVVLHYPNIVWLKVCVHS